MLWQVAGILHELIEADAEAMCPAFAPGTGTPEPGGLTPRELLAVVRRVCLELPVAGMEVVEVSPPYDPSGVTALVAHRIVLEALSAIAVRRRGGGPRPELPARQRDKRAGVLHSSTGTP